MIATSNIRITGFHPIPSPSLLKNELPMTEKSNRLVVESRNTIRNILEKRDARLLAVVGPCSIHDPAAAMEYASRLAALRDRVSDKIFLIMRTYFEKPRTVLGWKGLITDPHLNGTYDIEVGLRIARQLLLDITALGLPCGSEMLDPIIPQYIADLLSWASIGARTTESQKHREMASGLSMPVGFKNATTGDLKPALNAMESARHPQHFIGIDEEGRTTVFQTAGNELSHLVLRGGASGPNYHEETVEQAEKMIADIHVDPAIIIDCSHGNSGKQPAKQKRVLASLINQKSSGRNAIVGFMLESNLKDGSQKIPDDPAALVYGQSVTDACVGWAETEEILQEACRRLPAAAVPEAEG
ncbi:MAG: 3-deoxy-7-phosphoheptulonate synthase [Vicinamibacteria bacterium]|nr:3-deoxy-7-phosphoheptulonate synthase [Vicinamibacteria bacterium]